MNLASISVKRPVMIFMFILSLVVLGLTSITKLPVELFPKVDYPVVTVVTVYPGASPHEMENLVTEKIEDEFKSLSDLKKFTSDSLESVSFIMLEFTAESDLDAKAADVRDKVEAIKRSLPDDCEDPMVMTFDLDSLPILFAAVSSPRSLSEVRKTTEDVVKEYIERVPGVASVGLSGGREREIHVNVNRDKLAGYNLSILQVVQALAKDNLNVPAGKIKKGTDESIVRVVGEYVNVNEIEDVDIPTPMGLIKVKDIATVKDGYKDIANYARLNGNNAISLQVQKRSGANTAAVSDAVKEAFAELTGTEANGHGKSKKGKGAAATKRAILPADYSIKIGNDMSRFITDALKDVRESLFYGILFATIMVFVFLRDLRTTFIIFLTIPTSIISTFLPMYAAGFTINFMSLMGMALAVGTLVDNSVVVLENIFRHIEMGKKPMEATADATNEVGLAVLVSGSTNICVYMSVAFMSGTTGAFFKEFGLTIAFATIFSIIVAFTLTPALAARLLKERKEGAKEEMSPMQKRYLSVLTFCVNKRIVPIVVTLLLFVSAMIVIKQVPGEYVPASDQGELYVIYELPSYASLDDTNRVSLEVEELVKAIPEADTYITVVGSKLTRGSLEGMTQARYGYTTVRLVDYKDRERTTEQIVRLLRREVAEIPDTTFQVIQSSMGGPPGELPLVLDVTGPDLATLIPLADRVQKIVENTEGAMDITSSWQKGKKEIQVIPDKSKMASMGLDIATVGYTTRVSLEGDDSIKYKVGGDEYDVRIRFDEKMRESVEDVRNIPLMTMGGAVRLDNVAQVEQTLGPVNISRKDGRPSIRIQGNLGDRTIAEVANDIRDTVAEEDFMPVGYEVQFEGQMSEMEDMGLQMFLSMILAVLFVYMIMAAQFESFVHPFVVMFTLPLTFIGVAWVLFITGKTMNMMSMIGIVMLIGIVVNNGIIFIDFINQLRAKGVPRNDAVLQAGPLRLRPILITSMTTICGMLPAALLSGSGGGFRTPMAITALGGMIVSSALTLVFIPVMYTLFDDFIRFFKRMMGAKLDSVKSAESPEGKLYQ